MKKKIVMMLLGGITAGILPADAELTVTMEITSELPLLQGEYISGKVTLVNNGTEAVKLVKNKDKFWFVHTQVRFFVDTDTVPIKEQEIICGYPLHGIPYGDKLREAVRFDTNFAIDEERDFITLSVGQSHDFLFEGIGIDMLQFFHINKRLPFKAEMYVQPDQWIPITITSPLEFAKDAKSKLITPNSILKAEKNPFYVARVNIGTNEFLRVSGSGNRRLIDLSPDDQVEQNDNTRITITHKDGTKTEITSGNVDSMVKQRQEKRKAKPTTGN